MVEIGGKPILWNILKFYSARGIKDFIICCGYMGHMIRRYFSEYFLYMSDFTFDLPRSLAIVPITRSGVPRQLEHAGQKMGSPVLLERRAAR